MSLIHFRDVCKAYGSDANALDHVELRIEEGEFVYLVGESGSGKSTLLRLLTREYKPSSGDIIVDHKNIDRMFRSSVTKYRRKLGVVFQDYRLLQDRTVYENVAYAMEVIDETDLQIRRRVPSVLKQVGLANKHKSKPRELSGGEQQRAAIARAIVNSPLIILADEPTGNLDPHNAEEIIRLLESINAHNTTVIVATHDRTIVNKFPHRVVTLCKGVVVRDSKEGGYE